MRGPNATAEERRYIYKCLATTLSHDIGENGSGYVFEDENGEELPTGARLRRRLRAAAQVLAALQKRSK